ncbi:unnamed protein product, partial [marine sediment metagenome]
MSAEESAVTAQTVRRANGKARAAAPAEVHSEIHAEPRNLRDPALYLNRELAQLEFNFRVLAQAQDASVPLLERMRFLCISNSNLDEFFEVQVAVLRHHVAFGDAKAGPDGTSPAELLARIRARVLDLVSAQYTFWND